MRALVAFAAVFAVVAIARADRRPAPTIGALPAHLIARVPASAVGFSSIDLEATRRSPALTAAVDRLVRELALDPVAIRTARSLAVARIPGVRAGLDASPHQPRAGVDRPHVGLADQPSPGALAFAAAWLDAGTQQQLARLLPELGNVTWIAGTLEVSPAGFTLAGSAAFGDPYAAARIGVSFEMLRKLAATQLPAAVARAVDKLSLTAVGSAVWIRATWTEADLAAVLATL